MTQHTPGPWTTGTYITFGVQDEATPIPVQRGPGDGDTIADVYTNATDAVLIAAAPETAVERDRLRQVNEAMLEALRAAHSALRTFSPNVPEAEQGWTSFDSDTLEAIEAAIAAEGE
tara:strand:- start:295 stop:645 length:351 start_codon:yes stop_codon:yes gene_type:complete